MSQELEGNLLAIQTGTATAVTNAILSGIVTEALNHGAIEEVYGALGGLVGLLREDLVDLAEESQQVIRGFRYTPSAALGTSDYIFKGDRDIERALRVIEKHNIHYIVVIGNATILASLNALCLAATKKGYEMRLIGIPQSGENNIAVTDHCLGYGSAVKAVATMVKEIANEQQSIGRLDNVSIVEVGETHTGWLIAGTTLVKQKNRPEDVPNVLCLPEVKFDLKSFLDEVQATLKKQRYCLIVTSDQLFDVDGNFLGLNVTTNEKVSISSYLAGCVQEQLGITPDVFTISATQRLSGAHISKADNDEAYLCGTKAVKAAIEGRTAKALTLVRGDGEGYTTEISYTALEEVIVQPKCFPADWIHENHVTLRHQFYKYGVPLIQGEVELPHENGLPRYVRMVNNLIDRELEGFQVS